MRQAGRRVTIQAAYELTKTHAELSTRPRFCDVDGPAAKENALSPTQAHRRKQEDEELRLREWKAKFLTPVADTVKFRKMSTRVAAAHAFFESEANHVFCCLKDADHEFLAQAIARDTSAFVTKGTLIVQAGSSAGLTVFLNRGIVACFCHQPAAKVALSGSSRSSREPQGGSSRLGEKIESKRAPALISEMSLVAGHPWSISIRAESDCEVNILMFIDVSL